MSLRIAVSVIAVLVTASVVLGQDVVPGRIVVRYREGGPPGATGRSSAQSSLDALHASIGVRGARPLFRGGEDQKAGLRERARNRFPQRAARAPKDAPARDLTGVYVLEIPDAADPKEAATRLAADPRVAYAEPDYLFHLDFVPDDPFYSSSGTWGQLYPDLWGLHLTEAETAWDVSNGAGITVAVVDTGFDTSHPDRAADVWTNSGEIAGNGIDDDNNGFVDDVHGWDFDGGDNDTADAHGHGTHVAGTIAAAGDNGLGVIGMAWGSRIMPVQAFGPSGSAASSTLAEAIVYAAENGADVINASFGGPVKTQVMADAVATAVSLGVVLVAAAGNSSDNVNFYEPASLPGVIAVSATNDLDQPASFTNHGDAISVAAPGVDVLSLRAAGTALGPTVATDYTRLQGTSMATPHVAGLAAVLLAAMPSLDIDEVRWHLELNADQPGWPGYEGDLWNPYLGYGRINAARVFDATPATSRIRPRRAERHVYTGSVGALTDLSISFTTHDPVDWSLTLPPWLDGSPASGTGAAQTALSWDTTALPAGQMVTDSVTADAANLDATESFDATLYTHRDDRTDGEVGVVVNSSPFTPFFFGDWSIRTASNGSSAMAVWYSPAYGVQAVCMDGSATVVGGMAISGAQTRWNFDVASDGTNFLVVWIDEPDTLLDVRRVRQVLARRFAPDCTALDPAPIVIDERYYRPYLIAYFPCVGFDGSAYTVLWQTRYVLIRGSSGAYKTRFYLRRVASDGLQAPKRRRVSTRQSQRQHPIQDVGFDCRSAGGCLLTWRWWWTQYAVPIVGERPDFRRRQIVFPGFDDIFNVDDLVAGPDDYLLVGRRATTCDTTAPLVIGPLECKENVRALRISPDAVKLTPTAVSVNQGVPVFMPRRGRARAVADGSSFLVSFNRPWRFDAGGPGGGDVFVGRVLGDGSIADVEQEGLLVAPIGSSTETAITRIGSDTLVLWNDSRNAAYQTFGNPAANSLYVQRLTLTP